jgi:DNA-binding transcriptional LysR family regulator
MGLFPAFLNYYKCKVIVSIFGIMTMHGRLERLQTFVEVAEKNSFSGAGRQLNMSAPVVTRHIAELEAELGVQLLVRSTRSVSLMEAGLRYLQEVKPLIAGLTRADEVVRAEQFGLSGKLRVNAPMSFGQRFLPTAISRFRILHQAVSVQLTLDDGFIDIMEGQFDLALRISAPPRDKSSIWRKLCLVPRVLVASPDYVSQHGMPQSVDELMSHQCLGYAGADGLASWRLLSGRRSVDVTQFAFTCNNGDVLADLAALGQGIALLPQFIVIDALNTGRLSQVLPDCAAPDIWLSVFYPSYDRLSAKVSAFTDFIADAIAPELPLHV